jgi:AraC-like DNA-binding protein
LDTCEANLRATIAPSTLVDFEPLSVGPFHLRSTGWSTGNVGVTIGEQSAIRLITAHSDVVRLWIPLRGGSRYRQAAQRAASEAGESWVYLSDLGVHLNTSDNHLGVALSLDKVQLRHTVQAMQADPADEVADALREISLHSSAAKRALRMLPALLHHLHEVQRYGPDAVKHAEDMAYRFVAFLLTDKSEQPRELMTSRRAQQVVDNACSFMMTRLESPPTMTAVESQVGVSSRTLQAAFITCLHTSPCDWFRRQRLHVARHLLATGRVASVTEAALACGFQHLGRFAGEFRAQFGLSPHKVIYQPSRGADSSARRSCI